MFIAFTSVSEDKKQHAVSAHMKCVDMLMFQLFWGPHREYSVVLCVY